MVRWLIGFLLLFPPSLAQAQLVGRFEPGSEVSYRASDPRGSFVGRAPVEGLELRLYPDNLRRTGLTVVLRPERFDSGNAIRDINARLTVFESERFPEIVFTLSGVSAETLPEAGTSTVRLEGTLELHGVTRPLEVEVRLERDGQRLTVTGSFEVLLSDFGMSRPSFLVWRVDDRVTVTLVLKLRLLESD